MEGKFGARELLKKRVNVSMQTVHVCNTKLETALGNDYLSTTTNSAGHSILFGIAVAFRN